MEVADLSGNRTKEMVLILFRSKIVCVGATLSLEAMLEKHLDLRLMLVNSSAKGSPPLLASPMEVVPDLVMNKILPLSAPK